MFDIGWGELVVIGIVALIVIGPKELPAVLRTAGQWMGKIRRMASEFQNQFQEAMREAEMAELKKQVDEMSKAATDLPHFDPLETARSEMQRAVEGTAAVPAPSPEAPASPAAGSAAGSDSRAAAFSGADVDAAALAATDVPQPPPPPPLPEAAPSAAPRPPERDGGRS